MKVAKSLTVAVSLAAAFALSPAMAQQPAAPAKAMVKDLAATVEAVKVTAVVTAIDAKNRIVTIKGPEGNEFSVLADGSVKNFGLVKVGDQMKITYSDAVAIGFTPAK